MSRSLLAKLTFTGLLGVVTCLTLVIASAPAAAVPWIPPPFCPALECSGSFTVDLNAQCHYFDKSSQCLFSCREASMEKEFYPHLRVPCRANCNIL